MFEHIADLLAQKAKETVKPIILDLPTDLDARIQKDQFGGYNIPIWDLALVKHEKSADKVGFDWIAL